MTVTVTLDNFFGAKKNTIQLSSFMIFCGDNGSGKTHLVKILNSIDESIRNPSSRVYFNHDELLDHEYFPLSNISVDDFFTEKEFIFSIKSKDDFHEYLEKIINSYINNNKESLLDSTFSNSQEVLDNLSIKLSKKPSMEFKISLKKSESTNQEIKNKENKTDIAEEENIEFTVVSSSLNNSSSSILSIPINFFDHSDNFEGKSRVIKEFISERIVNSFIKLFYVENFNIPLSKTVYFPASREAYMRDFSFFFNKSNKEQESVLIKEYEFEFKTNEEGSEYSNHHSNDPYVENYINQMIKIMGGSDRFNKEIVDFIEKEFLKAKIKSSKSQHSYILDNKKVISPDLGSSLQNEYSFLRILIGNRSTFNLVVEEPEAHLSIKNTILLTYIFIALHQKIMGKMWITTHSNFVVDAINNVIMLSNLPKDKQLPYLESLGIKNILPTLDKSKTNEIGAYFLKDSKAKRLKRNEFGIVYDSFLESINAFVNISTDLQWEVEKIIEERETNL